MMPKLVSLLERNLRTTGFLAVLLLGTGFFAAFRLSREVEPPVHANYAVVTAALPGANAGELLGAVTRPVEELLRRTPGVIDFDSRTADGVCVFTARLADKDPLEIRERLRGQLAELHTALAEGIFGLSGPRLDDTVSATYDLVAGVAAPGGDLHKLRAALPSLTRELSSIPEVESVEVIGLPAEQIVVEYADAELADAGLSPQGLAGLLKAQSVVAPGGYLDNRKTVASLHLDGRVPSLDDLRTVGVLDPVTGRATVLDRLLGIRTEARTPPPPSVTVAGAPGVQIAVARRAGSDLRAFSTQVRTTLDRAAAVAGVPKPAVLIDSSDFVRREYRHFADGLIVAGLAIFVLLVATMGWRAGSVVAFMLPLVLFSTLALLQLAGFRLNLVVLAALTIASGIIVDNHIVVVQFISRRLHRGEERGAVIGEAFRVLSGPLLAATLTAVAGFLPIVLTHHPAAEYIADLVPVVAIALGLSYLFAFALTPFLCRPAPASSAWVRRLESGYGRVLGSAMRRPAAVLGCAALVAAVGGGLLLARPATFFPTNQSTMLAVEVLRPAGTSQRVVESDIAAVGERITKTLRESGLAADAAWTTLSGRDLPRTSGVALAEPPAPNDAVALVSLPSPEALAKFRASFQLPPALAADKGASVRLREVSGGPQASWPVRVRLCGAADNVAKAAAAAEKALAANPALVGLHRETGGQGAKWTLTLKRKEAADKSVTPADIALAMNAALDGLPCFDLTEGEITTPVIVRAKSTDADPIDNLRDAYVYPIKGRPCLLSDVAEVKPLAEPLSYERLRGVPAITFAADGAPGENPYAVETAAVETLRRTLAPFGVEVQSAGLAATAGKANHQVLTQMPWALAAVWLVLLAQTRSVRLSLLVLAAIPLGVAGSGFGLALAGMPMGFMPLVGLTAMAGIVVNIAIVLTASLRAQTASDEEEIAAAAVDRAEPIALSVVCTLAGIVPLYVFGGPLWHSMAITMVAGLVLATTFLMVVIPPVFRWCGGSSRR